MITEDAVPAYNKQFKQLVGSKILDFKMVQCDFDPHQYWPTFSMQLADQKYKLVLSQDEEGNGGGFAFIEQESIMFVDVIVKYKDQPERNVATIGQDSKYLDNVQQDFVDYPDLEYIRLELSTYWRQKRDERTKSI